MGQTDLDRDFEAMFGYDLWGPRGPLDEDIHPETLRGQALAVMDAMEDAARRIREAIEESDE